MDIILSNINIELNAFKEWILTLNPEEIWGLSNQITFYQEVHEYFSYSSTYSYNYEVLSYMTINLIHSLWQLHLRSEIYHGSRWDEIDFLINQLIESHKRYIA